MAAMTKSPVLISLSVLSQSILTVFSCSSGGKPKPFGPTGAVTLETKSFETSDKMMRSCGRFGPAKAGSI